MVHTLIVLYICQQQSGIRVSLSQQTGTFCLLLLECICGTTQLCRPRVVLYSPRHYLPVIFLLLQCLLGSSPRDVTETGTLSHAIVLRAGCAKRFLT